MITALSLLSTSSSSSSACKQFNVGYNRKALAPAGRALVILPISLELSVEISVKFIPVFTSLLYFIVSLYEFCAFELFMYKKCELYFIHKIVNVL